MNKIENNLIIELHIPDFEKARKFYSQFGFIDLHYDPTSGGGSDLGYLVLERKDSLGRTLLNFYGDKESVSQHAHFKDFSAVTPRGYGVEITIPISDVEGLWNLLKDEKELNFSQPLAVKRWGQKDFRIVDPFGFYIRFTELVDWGQ